MVLGVALLASSCVSTASAATTTCGSSTVNPGSTDNPGYALEADHTDMLSTYNVRVVAGSESWLESEVDYSIGQVNAATGAHLTHGSDAPHVDPVWNQVPPMGEIWVFTSTVQRPGNWTWTATHQSGHTVLGIVGIAPNQPASVHHHVVLHEMGHVVGLDHYFLPYQGECQVMSYGDSTSSKFKAGDLAGLARLSGHSYTPPVTAPPPRRTTPVDPITPQMPQMPTPPHFVPRGDLARMGALMDALNFLRH